MSKYDNFGGGDSDNNSGDNDYDDRNLKLEPPCKVRATLDGVFVSNSPYGQSLGISLQDVSLVDGIVGHSLKDEDNKPDQNGEPEDAFKVLSWQAESSVPVLSEDTTPDDLPEIVQRNYVGNNFYYEVEEDIVRLEEDPEGVGNPNVPEGEPSIYENMVLFAGSTEKGPKSKSKTLSKILCTQGADVVVDEDSQDEWLDQNAALREDLMGREVIIVMITKESDETGRTFHHPFVLDAKTNHPIFVSNEVPDAEDEEEQEEEEEEAEPEANGVPGDVQSFYDTCDELSITNEAAVESLLTEMMDDGDVSEDEVEEVGGKDAVIETVTA